MRLGLGKPRGGCSVPMLVTVGLLLSVAQRIWKGCDCWNPEEERRVESGVLRGTVTLEWGVWPSWGNLTGIQVRESILWSVASFWWPALAVTAKPREQGRPLWPPKAESMVGRSRQCIWYDKTWHPSHLPFQIFFFLFCQIKLTTVPLIILLWSVLYTYTSVSLAQVLIIFA